MVDLVHQAAGGEIGQPDTHGVTLALGRQVADDDPQDPRDRGLGLEILHAPADDVRVHPGPADVLAHFVDDQDIDVVGRKAGHEALRLLEQPPFFLLQATCRDADEVRGLVVGVLDDGQPEGHGRVV